MSQFYSADAKWRICGLLQPHSDSDAGWKTNAWSELKFPVDEIKWLGTWIARSRSV